MQATRRGQKNKIKNYIYFKLYCLAAFNKCLHELRYISCFLYYIINSLRAEVGLNSERNIQSDWMGNSERSSNLISYGQEENEAYGAAHPGVMFKPSALTSLPCVCVCVCVYVVGKEGRDRERSAA